MGYHYAGFEFRNDSVIRVDKWEFYHCNRTHPASGAKDSNTTVNLDRPGSFYFVSGDPEHCKNGQRLAVEVYPLHPISDSPPQPISMAPAPSPLSSSSAVSSSVPLAFISALLISDIVAVVEDSELADVAAVSAGNNYEIGNMIAEAMTKVGSKGVVTLEEGRGSENNLYVVEGMQFDRGYISPYFVIDNEKMVAEYENCKITNARDLVNVLEEAIKSGYPILVIAEDIEQEPLATLVVNKLRGALKIAALKAPGTVIREEVGNLDKAGSEVLGHAGKVVLTKESTTIVGDGSTQDAVSKRIAQIKRLLEAAEQDYEKEKLNERIAKLSGGVAVIQVGAQTETELKEKKLRVEDALNATKAAVDEGIVVGGGCTLLRLAVKVDDIKGTLDNDEQKLIAKNAGVNGSAVIEKVVRCCLEHAASVARTFLTSDAVVTEIKVPEPVVAGNL
ncbi:hypothetical protein RND71_017121 [Anisodus tanguticus]|uniref:Phytocyanin domain-containing protein n=1 Tax=Anisodus tanguticus TaxID=243964 RepID=A0AAE1S1S6_9SOLA|nr:hypothetical protein RND71_017121 [Anisodus tanguticus]